MSFHEEESKELREKFWELRRATSGLAVRIEHLEDCLKLAANTLTIANDFMKTSAQEITDLTERITKLEGVKNESKISTDITQNFIGSEFCSLQPNDTYSNTIDLYYFGKCDFKYTNREHYPCKVTVTVKCERIEARQED